jgi:hypothetical protein
MKNLEEVLTKLKPNNHIIRVMIKSGVEYAGFYSHSLEHIIAIAYKKEYNDSFKYISKKDIISIDVLY